MSNSVDRRVVEMEFDNAQFEKRVQTTRESLKALKKDLDFDDTSKKLSSLEKTANNLDISGVTAGLENISSKFSAMGVVGFTVLQNLTNGVINFGKKIANSTFGQILSGGKNRALNLEQAQFQIKGLGVDWEKATEYGESLREQIDKAVSGTAYGLDAAAKVAGQLLASNIKEGTQDMQNALSGISGVAAMTNSSYEEIGHIFTTIAGNGRLMTEQLNQFAGRGLNVASVLAKKFKVTEGELREMVSKGKVDFNTFAEAMNEAFGEQATKANDTYTGSLSNVRAALSRIGAEFQIPFLDNMRQTFVALIPVLNSIKTALGPAFEVAANGMAFFREEIVRTLGKFAVFDEKGKTVIKGMDAFAQKVKSFIDNLGSKDLTGHTVFDYLKQSYSSIKSIFTSVKNVVSDVIEPIQNAFTEMFPIHHIIGSIASGLEKVKNFLLKFEKAVNSSTKSGNALQRIASGIFSAFSLLINIVKPLGNVFGGLAIIIGKLLGYILRLLAPIGDLIKEIHVFFLESDIAKNALKPLSDAFKRLSSTIRTLVQAFKTAFNSAFAPFKKTLQENTKHVKSFTSRAIEAISKFASFFADKLKKVNDWLMSHAIDIRKFGSAIGETFGKIATNGLFKTAWNGLFSFFSKFAEGFKKFRDGISGTISSFGSIKTDGVTTLVDKFKASAGPLEAIGKFFASLWELLKSVFSKIGPLVGKLATVILDTFSGFAAALKDAIDSLSTVGGSGMLAAGGIVGFFVMILKKLKGNGWQTITRGISGLFWEIKSGIMDILKYTDKSYVRILQDFAKSILELAIAMVILSSIDPERLVTALGAISALMYELTSISKTLSGMSTKMFFWQKTDQTAIGTMLIQLSAAVLILAFALKALEDLNTEQIAKGTIAVSALLWELVAVVKVLSKNEKSMVKGASSLIFMAIAVRILVKAVAALSALSWEELAKGLVSTIALMLSLAIAVKLMSKSKGIVKAALGMILIATALKMLVPVVKELGSMDWKELAKAGVAIGGLLTILTLFSRFSKGGSMIANAVGLVVIAASLKIFVSAIKDFTEIPWRSLAKAGVTLTALLTTLTLFSRLSKGGKMIASAVGMTVLASSLLIFCISIKTFAGMKWEELGKAGAAIGSLLTMIVLFSRLCKPASLIANAVAMTVMGAAMLEFALVMKIFGSMSWGDLAKGLVAIAASFVIMGVAAKVLKPLTKTILALSVSMVLFGAGLTLVGVGILAISAGISGLIGTFMLLAKSFQFILVTVLESIPMIFKIVGAAIVAFLGVIRDAAPALADAFKAVVIAALDTLIAIAPKLGETIGVLLDTFLPILVEYTPKITDAIVSILIGIIDSLSERVPELIFSIANFFKKLVGAISEVAGSEITVETMKGIILGLTAVSLCMFIIARAAKTAQKALVGIAVMAGVMVLITAMFLILSSIEPQAFINIATGLSEAMLAISASMFIISKVPVTGALYGIAGFGIVVAGLMAILAILGGLNQIPGFTWLLEEGSKVLSLIGKAIGEFVGSIIGGILGGMANSLPGIADSLSDFMNRLQPFLKGARLIDDDVMSGVMKLVELILLMTVADFINGIASFVTGGVNFTDLGKQLCDFAICMVAFASTVAGIDTQAIVQAADAALALAQFAQAIPNSGGVAGFFTGENDIKDWAPQLAPFGEALSEFSKAVDGNINVEAIKAAAEAGKAIAEMASIIPNEGGVAGFFAGENSLSVFGPEIASFGQALANFSTAVDGKINSDAVKSATEAGILIAEMADKVPNEGGVASWFAGDNSLSVFGPEIAEFGKHIAEFSQEVDGKINPESVKAAVNAAKTIAQMADKVPNEGGVVSWFAGDNSLSVFGPEIAEFGKYLAEFSSNIGADFNTNGVKAAVQAAKMIAEMADKAPNEGGVVSWFAGDNSLAQFGPEIAEFGKYLAQFSNNLGSNFNAAGVKAAAYAGKMIADMADKVPNEGGVAGFFAGEKSLAKFGDQIVTFGSSLARFSVAVDGKVNKNAVSIAVEAGKSISSMMDKVPNEGGIVGFFAGEKNLSKFSSEMVSFGSSLARFSIAVDGKINEEAVKTAVIAASAIVELTNKIPNEGGVVSWFAGDNSLAKFGPEMVDFGSAIKGFSDSLKGIAVSRMMSAVRGVESIVNIATKLEGINSNNLSEFAKGLTDLGDACIDDFIDAFRNSESRTLAATKIFFNNLLSGMKQSQPDMISGLNVMTTTIINKILITINSRIRDFKIKGELLGKALGDGGLSKKDYISRQFMSALSNAVSALQNYNSKFYNSGMQFANGLGKGAYENRYLAINAAVKVAQEMLNATNKTLKVNSPSKEGEESSKFYDLGLANGLLKYAHVVRNAAEKNARGITDTTSMVLSSLSSINLDDIEVTPTIRPVMDLSNVYRGFNNISDMVKTSKTYSIGTAISSDRARINKDDLSITVETTNKDVVKAVNDLREEMSTMKDAMAKQKIYLDKKVLVGEIIDDVDTDLGRRAYKTRKAGR